MNCHYQLLRGVFKDSPVLVVDANADEVSLVTHGAALKRVRTAVLFCSATMMNLEKALSNFAGLVGQADRTFTLAELATVAGLPRTHAQHLTREKIVIPSVKPSRGSGRQRLFSWTDAFACGVVGALRRQGVPLRLLRMTSQQICGQCQTHETITGK